MLLLLIYYVDHHGINQTINHLKFTVAWVLKMEELVSLRYKLDISTKIFQPCQSNTNFKGQASCGIIIDSVQSKDSGRWQCRLKVKTTDGRVGWTKRKNTCQSSPPVLPCTQYITLRWSEDQLAIVGYYSSQISAFLAKMHAASLIVYENFKYDCIIFYKDNHLKIFEL